MTMSDRERRRWWLLRRRRPPAPKSSDWAAVMATVEREGTLGRYPASTYLGIKPGEG